MGGKDKRPPSENEIAEAKKLLADMAETISTVAGGALALIGVISLMDLSFYFEIESKVCFIIHLSRFLEITRSLGIADHMASIILFVPGFGLAVFGRAHLFYRR